MPIIWYKGKKIVDTIYDLTLETSSTLFTSAHKDSRREESISEIQPLIVTLVGNGSLLKELGSLQRIDVNHGSVTAALIREPELGIPVLLNAVVSNTSSTTLADDADVIRPILHTISDTICFLAENVEEAVEQVASWMARCKDVKIEEENQDGSKLSQPTAWILMRNAETKHIRQSFEQKFYGPSSIFNNRFRSLRSLFSKVRYELIGTAKQPLPQKILNSALIRRADRGFFNFLWSTPALARLIVRLHEQFLTDRYIVNFYKLIHGDKLCVAITRRCRPYVIKLPVEDRGHAMILLGHALAWHNARMEHGKLYSPSSMSEELTLSSVSSGSSLPECL